MLSDKKLAEKAHRICQEHAEKTIQGDIFIETAVSTKDWDQVQLRTVFEQSMVVWRRYGGFDVILDRHGLVAGFVDHQNYKDTGDLEMTAPEVTAIVAGERLVAPGATIVRFVEHKPRVDARTYKATYKLRHPTPDYDALEVEVNPKKRVLIAIRPVRLPAETK